MLLLHRLIAQIVLLLLISNPLAAQQYYRWVDENGTMHFSENPPPSNVEATQEEVPQTALTRGPSNQSVADDPAREVIRVDTMVPTR